MQIYYYFEEFFRNSYELQNCSLFFNFSQMQSNLWKLPLSHSEIHQNPQRYIIKIDFPFIRGQLTDILIITLAVSLIIICDPILMQDQISNGTNRTRGLRSLKFQDCEWCFNLANILKFCKKLEFVTKVLKVHTLKIWVFFIGELSCLRPDGHS